MKRKISEVGDFRRVFYGNPTYKVGECYDFWADTIEGEEGKAEVFIAAYRGVMQARGIKGVKSQRQEISVPGIWAMSRDFETTQKGVVTGALYVATIGSDLYLSWRVFVKLELSRLKQLIWMAICLLMAVPFSLEFSFQNDMSVDWGRLYYTFVGMMILTGLWIAAYGFIRRNGDFQALLRGPLNELLVDDIVAVGLSMHKSVLRAADRVGINSAKLAVKDPPYQNRQRRL